MSLDPRYEPTTGTSGPARLVSAPEAAAADGAFRLPEEMEHEIREIAKRFPPGSRSAVMPALDVVQEHYGHLTPETMARVGTLLDLDAGYVEGVATFYSLFHLQPIGKHHFYVCNNLSCMLRGAEEILAHIKERIGVEDYGDVSADGLFSVEPVECLGACEMAPMMRFEGAYHYDLTNEAVDALIDKYRRGTREDAPPAAKPRARKRG